MGNRVNRLHRFPSVFSCVLILKVEKVFCLRTLLEVSALKELRGVDRGPLALGGRRRTVRKQEEKDSAATPD